MTYVEVSVIGLYQNGNEIIFLHERITVHLPPKKKYSILKFLDNILVKWEPLFLINDTGYRLCLGEFGVFGIEQSTWGSQALKTHHPFGLS